MHLLKILGILFIAAGVLALIFGSFNYTRKTRRAKLGAVELSTRNRRKVNIPVWAGVALIVIGVVLLVLPG
jgi:uncharacterized membrane protein YidH (DUF202 family)